MVMSIILGVCVFGVFIVSLVRCRKKLDFGDQVLLGCFVLAVLAATVRGPLSAIQPISGSRYFFYPFTFLSWIFLQMAAKGDRIQRLTIMVILLLTLRQTALIGQHLNDKLDWKSEIMSCANSDSYELPILYDGSRKKAWHFKITGAQCRELISNSLFNNHFVEKK